MTILLIVVFIIIAIMWLFKIQFDKTPEDIWLLWYTNFNGERKYIMLN